MITYKQLNANQLDDEQSTDVFVENVLLGRIERCKGEHVWYTSWVFTSEKYPKLNRKVYGMSLKRCKLTLDLESNLPSNHKLFAEFLLDKKENETYEQWLEKCLDDARLRLDDYYLSEN